MTQPKPNTMDDNWIDSLYATVRAGKDPDTGQLHITETEFKALITAKLKEVDREARISELEDLPTGNWTDPALEDVKDRLSSLKGGDV